MPSGRILNLLLWSQINSTGDWFHARYVLTEKGGIGFEGLDEGENIGQRTNVFRLGTELLKDRWDSLEENSKAYRLLGTIQVVGK